MNSKEMTTDNKDKLKRQLRIAILLVVGLWVSIPMIVILLLGKPEGPGTLGDTFGIVNALFSSLAFALLIYTSMMQREELELQRNELELTRNELKKSAEAQSTLVNLTREQLELEKAIRRSQVRPEFVINSSRWKPGTDDSVIFMLTLDVKYYKLKLKEVEVNGEEKEKLKLDPKSLSNYQEKYLNPEENIVLNFFAPNNDHLNTDGLKIIINFCDVDGRKYYQALTFFGQITHLSNVNYLEAWGIE